MHFRNSFSLTFARQKNEIKWKKRLASESHSAADSSEFISRSLVDSVCVCDKFPDYYCCASARKYILVHNIWYIIVGCTFSYAKNIFYIGDSLREFIHTQNDRKK